MDRRPFDPPPPAVLPLGCLACCTSQGLARLEKSAWGFDTARWSRGRPGGQGFSESNGSKMAYDGLHDGKESPQVRPRWCKM
eukprot:1317221-Pyramimonas_sp.AAC.1